MENFQKWPFGTCSLIKQDQARASLKKMKKELHSVDNVVKHQLVVEECHYHHWGGNSCGRQPGDRRQMCRDLGAKGSSGDTRHDIVVLGGDAHEAEVWTPLDTYNNEQRV